MPKIDLKQQENEAWDRLLAQIDDTFVDGKAKPEEVSNLAAAIKEYKMCHSKRFENEKKGKNE